jgi:hypothetical protein
VFFGFASSWHVRELRSGMADQTGAANDLGGIMDAVFGQFSELFIGDRHVSLPVLFEIGDFPHVATTCPRRGHRAAVANPADGRRVGAYQPFLWSGTRWVRVRGKLLSEHQESAR